ncbi:hypothetical protein EYB25_001645 [Talaromyces marneffei]|nr:hypothetical protein EYB25_001645 [Talaromyces marneffei]
MSWSWRRGMRILMVENGWTKNETESDSERGAGAKRDAIGRSDQSAVRGQQYQAPTVTEAAMVWLLPFHTASPGSPLLINGRRIFLGSPPTTADSAATGHCTVYTTLRAIAQRVKRLKPNASPGTMNKGSTADSALQMGASLGAVRRQRGDCDSVRQYRTTKPSMHETVAA